MGVLELLEKNRTEARDRRMALIAAEDAAAAAVKKEYSQSCWANAGLVAADKIHILGFKAREKEENYW